jgi:hypothetical protein
MTLQQLTRVRHGARAALTLGVAVSIVANILHAADHVISQAIAAWAPIALLITIELIARVPVRRGWLSVARLLATTTIAGIAAWVSYWHMAGVALRYGEEQGAAHLIPLTVDGLVVVAWVCLVEIGGRIRELHQPAGTTPAPPVPAVSAPVAPVFLAPVSSPPSLLEEVDRDPWDYAEPIGPEPVSAPPLSDNVTDNVTDRKPAARRSPPSSRDRVIAAHGRTPSASNEELAARLKLSVKTIERHRPPRLSDSVTDSEASEPSINGHQPDLVGRR